MDMSSVFNRRLESPYLKSHFPVLERPNPLVKPTFQSMFPPQAFIMASIEPSSELHSDNSLAMVLYKPPVKRYLPPVERHLLTLTLEIRHKIFN
jgi:hypothetical protein